MRRAAVPVGVALAIGAAVAYLVPPQWRAAGLPYVLGYGKNVEHAAVTAAFLAAAVSAWLLESKRRARGWNALAVAGFALVAALADVEALLAAAPQLLFVALLYCALRRSAPAEGDPRGDLAAPGGRDLPVAASVLALAGLALGAFVLALQPLEIDVYHHGEVLASAVDLLRGGRPFETFLWPHGLHDTGLTAAWILLTGKVGTSPIALAQATCRAFGVVAIFALAFRLLGSRKAALAASSGLVLALAWHGIDSPGPAALLRQLGVLLFVALGFVTLLGRRKELAAGALFGLAYLFRVETGVYAAVAALAVLAGRDLGAAPASWQEAGRSFVSSLSRLLGGAAATLLLFRLAFGWPGATWFTYTLRDLPRYHGDSSGLPFPWPLRGMGTGDPGPAVGMGLGALALAVLLVIEAARRRHSFSLWFLALFAALATRSTLGRSDEAHLLQWTALPALAAILMTVAGLRRRFSWSERSTALALFVSLGILDPGRLTVLPRVLGGLPSWADVERPWSLLLEHLRPNPGVGACGDESFTPTEARRETNRSFLEATCKVEGLLREHNVTRLAIQHSAPWYYVRFGLPLPTRFFSLARAYTPEQQRALVLDLRAHRPQALLRARGFAALERLEVPDAVRVPLVDAYLRERRGDVSPRLTALGDLYFWNEPVAAPLPSSWPDPPAVGVAVERMFYEPTNRLFFAEGWAADVGRPQPLRSLTPLRDPREARGGWARLDYGRLRPDLAPDCAGSRPPACGFEYSAFIAPEDLAVLRQAGVVDLTAVTLEGVSSRVELSLAKLHVLGPLTGGAWRDLGSAVAEAAALGAADRQEALAASGRGEASP